MLKNLRDKVTDAVKRVYAQTDRIYPVCEEHEVEVKFFIPGEIEFERTVVIARSVRKDDIYYKLYIPKFDEDPFLTVFGCWPEEWVIDIFVRTLQHFYDLYEEES